jgi:hypothetical protein
MANFFNMHNDSIYQENKKEMPKILAQMSFYNKDSNLRLSDAMLLRGSIISLKDPIMTTMESKESKSGLGDEMLIQLNQSNYLSGNGDS